ncbi:hypothetical protein LCGC14_1879280 [marine sediment metagenome]|uniref:NnrU domain-containing protein n=1 Tax=marine sediment metagenome TaxID=412755 RepID=A0A0F9G2Q3_9ZZZZ
MGHIEAVILTLTACMAFGLVHSLLVLESVKDLTVKIVGAQKVKAFYRLVFTMISIVTAVTTVYLILRIPDVVLFKGPVWWRSLMYFGEVLGLVFGALAFRVIDLKEFLGLRQAIRYIRTGDSGGDLEGITGKGFLASGVYGIVRHPLYFAGIVIFTLQPVVTRNWLAVAVLADLYFIYGALVEQKRLLELFGDKYRDYMGRVPLLVPTIRLRKK